MKEYWPVPFNKKLIKEISELFGKYGYTFDTFFPEVHYFGPRGGSRDHKIDDFFESLREKLVQLERDRIEPMKPIPVKDIFEHPYLKKLGKEIIIAD